MLPRNSCRQAEGTGNGIDAPGTRLGCVVQGELVAQQHAEAHILVINDTPQLLDLFQELLSDAGYQVTPDRFTLETDRLLERVKAIEPDLIVLDLIIGDEHRGWQFLQMLEMTPETRTIPVVVCTAAVHLVRELQPHLDSMGIQVVLKPFDIDHLLGTIAKSLEPAPPADGEGTDTS